MSNFVAPTVDFMPRLEYKRHNNAHAKAFINKEQNQFHLSFKYYSEEIRLLMSAAGGCV